ncbi:MAG: Fe-S cluster assembly protein SufD [Pirellulaceae bacterium]|jgi:Fe-S cluster assembly protein SufD
MTQAMTQLGFTQEAFDSLLQTRDEPDWLQQIRRQSWQKFQELDWPARNAEEWIRTDIRMFKLDKFNLPLEANSIDDMPTGLLCDGVELGGQSISLDSHSTRSEISADLASKGVLFGSLAELVKTHGDTLRPHIERAIVARDTDKFSALNAACWTGGHILYVPRGVVVKEPIHALSVLSNGGVDLGKILVILEDGAEATLLTETESESETAEGMHCGSIEIVIGNDAHLRYVSLQNWSQRVWHFAHQKAIVGRDSTLQWTMAAMGSRLAKVNQHVSLAGDGAQCQVNGVLFTEGKQHLSYHTLQHHENPSCRSDFLYKAALQDKSRTVWRGMIKVDPTAQKTDGYQRNDNLLLSDSARADSIPGLEIEADDVRCTHGSTTGRVDDELIFYAMCRGFTRKEAIRAIVIGFFQQIFDRITIDSVRDALGHAIARRIREYE